MRMLVSLVVFMFASLPALCVEPARALGFEIGKATVQEVRAAMTERAGPAKEEGTSPITTGAVLVFGADPAIKGLQGETFVFGRDGMLAAVVLTLPKHRYTEVLAALKAKYALVNAVDPFVGNRSARLRSGDVLIDVESPHLSFEMSVVYATRRFHELMDAHLKAKAQAEQRCNVQSF